MAVNKLDTDRDDRTHESSRLPPGFRFYPTDEELVCYYLTNKVLDSNLAFQAIGVVDFNKCEPWDLRAEAETDENVFYFFGLRDRKYPTGMRTNRATRAGYWKATGKDRQVVMNSNGRVVGMKKTLVFYTGRAPKGEKSNWIMHEYRLEGESGPDQQEWVVCRVFEKSTSSKRIASELNRNFGDHADYSNDRTSSFLPALQSLEAPSLQSVISTSSFAGRSQIFEPQGYPPVSNDRKCSFLPALQSLEFSSLRSVKPTASCSFPGPSQISEPQGSSQVAPIYEPQGYSQVATYPGHETILRRSNSSLKVRKNLPFGDSLENFVAGWDMQFSPDALWDVSAAP